MSAEANERVIREAWEAWERGDRNGAVAAFAPDAEIIASEESPLGTYTGPGGYLTYLDESAEPFESFEVRPEEIRGSPDGGVLVIAARFEVDGVAMDDRFAQAWDIRDGVVKRVRTFRQAQDAKRAAGLAS